MKSITSSFRYMAALLVLAALLIGACGGSDQAGSARNEMAPAEDQVLNLRISGEPKGIDPHRASVLTEISIVKQLFSALFRYDENLNVVADMAARVPTVENGGISSDGLTYTIDLREGLTWSDGAPLTADDVVYSFKRMLDPKLASPYASNYRSIAGAKAYYGAFGTKSSPKDPTDEDIAAFRDAVGITAKDSDTIVFKLSSPSVSFLNQLALWTAAPVRQDIVEKYGDAWTEAGNLVGNGPFVLKEWVHNSHFTLEANPNWHLGKAKLQRVNIRIIEDDVAAYAAYLAGELDVTAVPPASRQEVATPGSSLYDQLVRKADLATFALMFNNAEKPFDNLKVRQAFGTAFDRKTYVSAVLQGVGAPATSWLPPGMPGFDDSVGAQYEFNLAKARQLLAEAGYPDGAGLPAVTLTMRSNDTNRLIAQFMQEQYKQNLGVTIEVDLVDSATYQSRFTSGNFVLTISSWSADWAYPDNWLPDLFGSASSSNIFHYKNTKVDDLLKQALAETDAEKQLALFGEAHKAIIDDAAIVPIYNRETFVLVNPRVRDLKMTGLDGNLRGDWNLWQTWIARG